MTEQIKSAIDHYRDVCVQMGQYPESDTYRYAEVAIRSLQAWDEVIEELEMLADVCNDANDLDYASGLEKSIDLIKQKLAEIE